jgi:hypothetical protein
MIAALGRPPAGEKRGDLGQSGERRDHSDAGDPAADEVVLEPQPRRGVRNREEIPVPERRPGADDQNDARLDEVRRKQKTAERANG